MSRRETPGIKAPTTLPTIPIEIELPTYVVRRRRKRADGSERSSYWFEVPKRLRPKDWTPVYQLPLKEEQRTGDIAELMAVIEDGKALYKRLEIARNPASEDDAERAALKAAEKIEGTVPWLIATFKAPAGDDVQPSKWHTMEASSRVNYEYAFRAIVSWSSSRRPTPHPPIVTMKLPQILKLLNKSASKPSKQRMVKAALAALFDVARFEGLYEGPNPIQDLPLSPRRTRDPLEWPGELVDDMRAHAVAIGRPSIALFLTIKWWYGWRTRDIVRFQEPQHLKDGAFSFISGKKKRFIGADVVDEVDNMLALTRPIGTHIGRPIIMNEETGLAYNERILSKHIKEMIDAFAAAEVVRIWLGEKRRYPEVDVWKLKPGMLRHTVMTQLEKLDVVDGKSAALVGHSPSSHARMKDTAYRVRSPALANAAVESLKAHRKK